MSKIDDFLSETDGMKTSIGGIKFSEELVQVAHCVISPFDRSFVDLIERIAEKRINLPFVCAGTVGDESHSTFCVAATDFALVEELLYAQPFLSEEKYQQPSAGLFTRNQFQVTHGVGTLTLFPHRRSLAMLGHIVEILGQSGIEIHSFCTSISAVAINVDYPLLDRAVEVLERIVELPDNHAPFRPEFSVRQISP
jgi:hypothetical protein